MKRVIVRVTGGIGNQMFQYATARAVAIRNDGELLLDIRELFKPGQRRYSLSQFRIAARIADFSELPPTRHSKIGYGLWYLFGSNPRLVKERGLALNKNILTLGLGCYLQGYFQSEKYFVDCAQAIRQEFQFKSPPPNEINVILLKQMLSENSVSLHVRRGDYLTSSNFDIFAKCSKNYYRSAISLIAKRTGSLVIYVFSDDPNWARDNLRFEFPMIVLDHNQGEMDYEDLRLMSSCRHNIIANSTFSWWGAWLNRNPNKIVIAPRVWFAPGIDDNLDIIPPYWIRLKN